MRKVVFFIIVFLMSGYGASSQDDVDSKESGDVPIKLESAGDALQRALDLTGFGDRMKVNPARSITDSVAKKVIINKDSTAFLSNQILGRELWQINLKNVDIRTKLAISMGADMWKKKDFNILLDPTTGKVLRIYSIPLNEDSKCILENNADEETERLKIDGKIYHGFPDVMSKITFVEALNAAAGCTPLVANEINAYYVLYSKNGSDPKPVWSITSIGISAPPFASGEHDEEGTECYNCIVDAQTGKWLSVSSVPCYSPKPMNGEGTREK